MSGQSGHPSLYVERERERDLYCSLENIPCILFLLKDSNVHLIILSIFSSHLIKTLYCSGIAIFPIGQGYVVFTSLIAVI